MANRKALQGHDMYIMLLDQGYISPCLEISLLPPLSLFEPHTVWNTLKEGSDPQSRLRTGPSKSKSVHGSRRARLYM